MAVSKSTRSRESMQTASSDRHTPPIADSAPVPADASAEAARPQRSPRLVPALIVFGLWLCVLIGLAAFSANPTTLNHAQITAAPLVVEATVDPNDRTRWQVSRTWPERQIDAPIEIEGLDDLPFETGQSYLIPVEPVGGGGYRLVPLPKPLGRSLIYPANPQTIAELEAILNDT